MGVTSIRLAVDFRTFKRFQRSWSALGGAREVPLTDVGAKIPGIPASVSMSGLELLLAIGRASSRPERSSDPSRLFALLRYGTSIAACSDLRLKNDVNDLDSHKKKVLSDEFGAGMAMRIAEVTCGRANWLDFETAERRGFVRTKVPRSRQPDFAGLSRTGTKAVILEAKGTQSSDRYCEFTQIPSGCEQLAEAKLVGAWKGIESTRIVVGVALKYRKDASGSRVFVGDPDGDGNSEYDFQLSPEDAIVRSHYLRVASLTGDTELERELLSPSPQLRRREAALEVRTLSGKRFVGSGLTVTDGKQQIELFVGLEDGWRQLLLSGEFREVLSRSQTLSHRESGALQGGTDVSVMRLLEDGTAIAFEGPSEPVIRRPQ